MVTLPARPRAGRAKVTTVKLRPVGSRRTAPAWSVTGNGGSGAIGNWTDVTGTKNVPRESGSVVWPSAVRYVAVPQAIQRRMRVEAAPPPATLIGTSGTWTAAGDSE